MLLTYKQILNIEKDIEELTMEELIKLIREFHQLIIYTVDETWCVQLLDLKMCGNDEGSCDWESGDTDLIKVLRQAVIYIAECLYDN